MTARKTTEHAKLQCVEASVRARIFSGHVLCYLLAVKFIWPQHARTVREEMMLQQIVSGLIAVMLLGPALCHALVNYDQGQRVIKGVQLLQDFSDADMYYYVPRFPRLATKDDGTFEILCLKFVDSKDGATNGGLFHALIEFSLPPEVQQEVEKELRKQVPNAKLAGAVPLLQSAEKSEKGDDGTGAFQIVSSVLRDRGEKAFTRSLVTSGRAPLTPGSKAVVAAVLNQQGATLLWDSLTGPTSDVSVAIQAYYEAAVQGYNAKVTADMSTVYTHFSRTSNVQQQYTKRQLRKVIDDLQRNGVLKVEVFDRSKSLGIEAKDMDGVLQTVTDKLTELMFDHTSGWATDPPREAAVEANQLQGRQERGWFSSVFGGAQDTPYFTDDQYVLKDRKDVRHNSFSLVLSKGTTIKVPVDTAGNLGGLYKAMGTDQRYFRVVNLNDPAFQFRSVHFQVDGSYLDSFQDTINFVSVNMRKLYTDQPAFTQSLHYTKEEIKNGKTTQNIAYPRLAITGDEWQDYEYQVRWSVRNGATITIPADESKWIRSRDAAISLVPPFERRTVIVEADRQLFAQRGVMTAVIECGSYLAGKKQLERKAILRAKDASASQDIAIYHDRDTPIAARISWYGANGKAAQQQMLVEQDYLALVPPQVAAPVTPAGPNSPPAPPVIPTDSVPAQPSPAIPSAPIAPGGIQ
jgi:hypothetical protein